MLSFKAFAVLVLPLLVVANPLAARTNSGSCNSGSLNCCQETNPTVGSGGGDLLGSLLNGLLSGKGCSPILSLVGGGYTSCNQQTVCCTGNSFNGLVAIGCTPINLNM